MTSSFTTNKSLEKPANGDYVNTWNVPVNGDMDVIDQAFGGVTGLNATSGSATLTAAQYRSLTFSVTGSLSAGATYTIPTGVGGQWIVSNTTTDASGGPWPIVFASGGGGTTATIPRTSIVSIFSDGTNINFVSTPSGAGSTTQVIYNSGGILTGSANLTFDGTTLSAATIYSPSTITATGAITSAAAVTAFSDRSLKRDIQTIEHAIDLVKRMRGVSYEMINTGALGIGVIAQEMQEVVPQVVLDNNGILSVAYGNLVGVLIEAVKEMAARIDELERKTPV